MTITTPAQAGASPGDLFLAPYQGEGTPGPMITEQDGALVWFHPLPAGYESTNFQVQLLRRQAGADLVAGAHPEGRASGRAKT